MVSALIYQMLDLFSALWPVQKKSILVSKLNSQCPVNIGKNKAYLKLSPNSFQPTPFLNIVHYICASISTSLIFKSV